MHYEIEPHLPFDLAPKLEWLYFRCYSFYQHLAMPQHERPTTGLYHICEPAVNNVFSQGTLWYGHLPVYQHARIHLQHTKDLAAKLHSFVAHQHQQTFEALSLGIAQRDQSRATHHGHRHQP